MSLPNLSALQLKGHSELKENAHDGVYCLDRVEDLANCTSSVIIVRNALPFSDEQTDELETFMSDEKNVKVTMTRYGTAVLRRQATFGAAYNFGQENTTIPYPKDGDQQWPTAVQSVLETVKSMAESVGFDSSLYNAVHANWYPSGKSGVAPHFDKEQEMIRGLPIFSFTLLAGDKKPRRFDILRKANAAELENQRAGFARKREESYTKQMQRYEEQKNKASKDGKPAPKPPTKSSTKFEAEPILLYSVSLNHGDLLVMKGMMQDYYLHSVPPNKTKEFLNARRMNLTVRAFKETA
jgi:alkylated DNA repair dioxygenase AlkB